MRPDSGYHEPTLDAVNEAICQVYGEWARAMADGTYLHRLPDPLYRWRGKVPDEKEIDDLLGGIDAYQHEQLSWARGKGFETGTHFQYLPAAQKLALVQELDQAIPPLGAAPSVPAPDDTGASDAFVPSGIYTEYFCIPSTSDELGTP